MKLPLSGRKSEKYPFQNPSKEPLTAEKLRTFPGCEHYSLEEAEQLVRAIDQLARLLFECHQDKSICIDNQQVVNLKEEQNEPKVISLTAKNKAA